MSSAKTTQLCNSDSDELLEVFSTFDHNADGLICKNDLGLLFSKLGCPASDEELSRMVRSIDHDGDGFINFEEFLTLFTYESEKDEEEDLQEAFKIFDKNRDGFISAEELHSVLLTLGIDDGGNCTSIIKNVDLDGDGKVGFSDFKHMMMPKPVRK